MGLPAGAFARLCLAPKGLAVGLYDSRYTLPLAGDEGEPVADDPSMARYVPGFVAAFHTMIRNDLGVKLERPYGAIVWRGVLERWNWNRTPDRAGESFASDLRSAMRRNDRLQVLVASGYYDLVTTAAQARHDLDAARLPADRIRLPGVRVGTYALPRRHRRVIRQRRARAGARRELNPSSEGGGGRKTRA